MRDTSEIHDEIHVSQIHPDRYVSDMKETCGIHARYMRDTSGYMYPQRQSRYMRDTCGIHAGYMRDTCGIHAGHVSRGCIDAIMESSAPIRPPMSSLCRNGSSPARSSSSSFSFVMATLIPHPWWFTALVEREAQQLLLLH